MRQIILALLLMVSVAINGQTQKEIDNVADYDKVEYLTKYLKTIGFTENVTDSNRLIKSEVLKDSITFETYKSTYYAENPQSKISVLVNSITSNDKRTIRIESVIFTFADKKQFKEYKSKVLADNKFGLKYKNKYVIAHSEYEAKIAVGKIKRVKADGIDPWLMNYYYIGRY